MLPESLLHAVSFTPRSLRFPNAWVGHLPFAAWLMRELKPHTFVELGTHSGNSFFSFCQAVVEAGLPTRCYAVDTWKGDGHAQYYGEEVFAEVTRHHQVHYAGFARLLRTTFDDAVSYFADESVDLLHIDGLHTYDAVRCDFETWLPKLKPGAVVLFHDTNVRERNFGVWRLWLELEQAYPRHLEFVHSHGLGVLQLNNAPAGAEVDWLVPGSPEQSMVLQFFGAMSAWHLERYELHEIGGETARLRDEVVRLNGTVADLNARTAEVVGWAEGKDRKIAEFRDGIIHRDAEITRRDQELAQLRAQVAHYAVLRNHWAWRLLAPPARAARRVRRRLMNRSPAPEAGPEGPALSGFFDAQWYLNGNPDVRAAGVDPLEHFASDGWRQGRSPHPLFDVRYYLETNPDVRAAGINPLVHFVVDGWREGRNPHPLFDTRWYLATHTDVRDAGVNPLAHYIRDGAAERRNPNPAFDAVRYVADHPDAAANPLIHYLVHGADPKEGPAPDSPATSAENPTSEPAAPTRHFFDVRACLPRGIASPPPTSEVTADIIIPVYKGHDETKRCIESVLADSDRPQGTIRVIDDCSPDTALSAWLVSLAAEGRIELTRNPVNRGFVASVNLGMASAGPRDVVLLNSDTEVPSGFVRRLAVHASASPTIGTVTPFSNYAGEMCSYPSETGGPLPSGYTMTQLDAACRLANDRQSVEIPVGRGYCLYIRRRCLDEVGLFDEQAFGRGYGEETDFCLRAGKAGWRHLLACDTFVYHAGQVSFGAVAPERDRSWSTLVERHPDLPAQLQRQLASAPTTPLAFAATAALLRVSGRPVVLAIAHGFHGSTPAPLSRDGASNDDDIALLLSNSSDGLEVSVPSLPGHPVLHLPADGLEAVLVYARACGVSRVDVRHWIGLGPDLRLFLNRLAVPVAITVHEYALA